MRSTIDFRPLRRDDFALLGGWLAAPHVARWWADDPSPAALEAQYGASIDGMEPAQVFIARMAGEPFGLAQRYALADYPIYDAQLAPIVPVPDAAWSLDYLIGPPGHLHRGFGSGLVRAFAQRLWHDTRDASCIVVPTHADNLASSRSLERAGFRCVARGELEPDNPADDRRHLVYRLDRP